MGLLFWRVEVCGCVGGDSHRNQQMVVDACRVVLTDACFA